MQIPMEALSLVKLRTGPGDITQPRMPARKDDFLFSKLLEAAHSDSGPVKTEQGSRNVMAEGKKAVPFTVAKRGRFEDIIEKLTSDDMSLAAGAMMGNQGKVVFILEGDMESGTDPDVDTIVNVDGADPAYAEAALMRESPAAAGEKRAADTVAEQADSSVMQAAVKADAVDTEITAEAAAAQAEAGGTDAVKSTSAAYAAYASGSPVAESYAGEEVSAYSDVKAVTVETDADGAAIEATGEAAARMPALRTSERSETQDGDDDPASFKDGDLSPLENVNDKPAVRGQKDKEYSKAEDAAKDTAANPVTQPDGMAPPVAADIRPERFRADQAMQKAPDAPVGTESLYDEMVSRIETSLTDNVRTMTIQLKPEFLGKVALEIAMDAAGLHVRISADDQNVRSMVNSQINALVETLQNKGIEVVEVEVAYTGVDNGAFTDPRKGEAQQPESPRRGRRHSDAAGAVTDEIASLTAAPIETLEYYRDAGVSSVEYRA